jgi:hypothetical protein
VKRLVNFVVFSNIWISLGAVGVTLTTFLFVNIVIDYYFLSLVFFATLFAYNLQNLAQRDFFKERSNQSLWIKTNYNLLKWITFFSFLTCLFLSIFLMNYFIVIISFPFLCLVFFYRNNFLEKIQLRNIPFLKIILISTCWSFTSAVLPQLIFKNSVDWQIIFTIFLYVLAITIPFDLRDMFLDNSKISTFPQLLGAKYAYTMSHLIIIGLFFNAFSYNLYGLCVFFIVTSLVLIPSINRKKEFYYLIILDGLLIIFPIFVL